MPVLIHQGRTWAPTAEAALEIIYNRFGNHVTPSIWQVGERGGLKWFEWSVLIK